MKHPPHGLLARNRNRFRALGRARAVVGHEHNEGAPWQCSMRNHLPDNLAASEQSRLFFCPLTNHVTDQLLFSFYFCFRSRSSFSRSAVRTKSAMLTSSCRAARSISRNMAFGMRAWIGVLSAAVNTLPRLRFRRGLVCGSRGTTPLLCPCPQLIHYLYTPLK